MISNGHHQQDDRHDQHDQDVRQRLGILDALLFAGDNDEMFRTVARCNTAADAMRYLAGLGLSTGESLAVLAMPLSDRIREHRNAIYVEANELRARLLLE